jgi:hypothetical protein
VTFRRPANGAPHSMSCCMEGAGVLHPDAPLDDNFSAHAVKGDMTETRAHIGNVATRRNISIMFAAAAAAALPFDPVKDFIGFPL